MCEKKYSCDLHTCILFWDRWRARTHSSWWYTVSSPTRTSIILSRGPSHASPGTTQHVGKATPFHVLIVQLITWVTARLSRYRYLRSPRHAFPGTARRVVYTPSFQVQLIMWAMPSFSRYSSLRGPRHALPGTALHLGYTKSFQV